MSGRKQGPCKRTLAKRAKLERRSFERRRADALAWDAMREESALRELRREQLCASMPNPMRPVFMAAGAALTLGTLVAYAWSVVQ